MRRNLTICLIAALVALGACATPENGADQSARQAEVAEKGKEVMPFDLEKTTHRFLPTDTGLRQEVVADNPDDTNQIALIRDHLTSEAARFRSGDFGDPASIHGSDMPGLTELSAGATAIAITLTDLDNGAALDFRTTDPALIQALHSWSEAQVSDHGSHAESTR
jgi:hypothetical protein